MRLAEFIADNIEVILAEWEVFAASLQPEANMTSLALRDHAPQILEAVVKDITTAQTREAQAEKSKGRGTQAAWLPRNGCADACRPAGPDRLRHQSNRRRISRTTCQRSPALDRCKSARRSEWERNNPVQ